MGKTLVPYLLLLILPLLANACAMAPESNLRSGSPGLYDLKAVTFTVESVNGQVQIKTHRNAPWHDLKKGEVFDGFALIRSGFRSNAELIMHEEGRSVRCDIYDLLCEISMRDIYFQLLSPSGLSDYVQRMWGQEERIDPKAPVRVSRATLRKDDETFSLLAEACDQLYPKDLSREVGGAAGAAAMPSSNC
jgi:hypothetical protein